MNEGKSGYSDREGIKKPLKGRWCMPMRMIYGIEQAELNPSEGIIIVIMKADRTKCVSNMYEQQSRRIDG